MFGRIYSFHFRSMFYFTYFIIYEVLSWQNNFAVSVALLDRRSANSLAGIREVRTNVISSLLVNEISIHLIVKVQLKLKVQRNEH